MPETAEHSCSYPPNGFMEPGPCMTCGKPPVRTVEVREPFLRAVLRDALAFAQALANSGDPEAPEAVAEYETALLELSSATPAEVSR